MNTPGAIVLTTAGGQTFRTQPLGLYYFDAASGQSVLLAPIQDSVGLLVPPNRVVYTNAFGALADLLYVYGTNGFEQNVVLLQAPPPPSAFGLSAATRLEVWTGFQGPAPLEERPVVLKQETDPVLRQTMAEPDLVDHVLVFADCWFPRGTAFVVDSSTLPAPGQPAGLMLARPSDTNQLFVAKKLVQMGQQTVLVESVDFEDLAPKLAALEHAALPPDPAKAGRLLARNRLGKSSTGRRERQEAGDASHSLAPRDTSGERAGERGRPSAQPMALARGPYTPRGVVLDYTVLSGSASSYTFTSGTTYYIPSGFWVGSGTATFQTNACLKFGSNASLVVYGPVCFPGCNSQTTTPSGLGPVSSGPPVIFTSADDNAWGAVITNSTGLPYYAASPALEFYYETGATTVNDVRVLWAQRGIEEDESSGVYVKPTISNTALENCNIGVYLNVANDTLSLSQVTQCAVVTPLYYVSGNYSGSITTDCELNTDKSFQGQTGATNDDNFFPPDTDGAVGLTNFVEILNTNIAVYDKIQGTRIDRLPTAKFFAFTDSGGTNYPTGTPYDPRVLYDQQSGCWVACAYDGGSQQALFAYKPDMNPLPLTNWNRMVLYLAKAGDKSDSPTLGVDDNGVYLSMLRWIPGFPNQVDDNITVCLRKPGVYQGNTKMTLLDTTTNDLMTWKVQPVVNLDSSSLGGWAWCVAKGLPQGTGTNYQPGTFYYRRIQWSGDVASWADLNGWQQLSLTNSTRYFDFDSNPTAAPGAPQLGGSKRVSLGFTGSRPQMAVIRNGYLWTCQHVGLDNTSGTYGGDETGSTVNRSGIQWWRLKLNLTGTPLTYASSGVVYDNAASNPYWYYMPSLAVNWANVMLLGFSGSSASNYISAFYTGRQAGGEVLAHPVLAQAGSAYVDSIYSVIQWGDYSYSTVDPADNLRFWTIQGFATNTAGRAWSDWIGSIKPGP